MAIELAKYKIYSWSRRGISNQISDPDDLGSGSSATIERAEVPVAVRLNQNLLPEKRFSLIGPGDIIGINSDMIVRTEPRNWITDAEPNYLALVEFYDEDFHYRYTPARNSDEKLRPWIILLVLKENEFERTTRKVPLPSIKIKAKEALPPYDETWLWAHVHSHADIPEATETEKSVEEYRKFLLSLNRTVNDDPDQLFGRLVCPRKLEANTAYYSFIVPAFETGRLAGLEMPTSGVPAQKPSWDNNGAGEMPVYYEWYFRTGTNTDFESLVKLIEARPMDERVGIRDMDCSNPGFVKADGSKPFPGSEPPIIRMEGALKAPTTKSTEFPDPKKERTFQIELEKLVNLPETIVANDTSRDPLVSVPYYGKNHVKKSLTETVLLNINKDYWADQLNKDPRTRVAAGFGTVVVQNNQENLMKKAWQEVEKIVQANKKIKAFKFSMYVALQYSRNYFNKFQETSYLAICNPILKRIKGSPFTLYHLLNESRLPSSVFSSTFRRLSRPRGAVTKKLCVNKRLDYAQFVKDANSGIISSCPSKQVPSGIFTTKDLAKKLFIVRLPSWLLWILRQDKIIMIALFIFLIFLAVITSHHLTYGAIAAAVGVISRFLHQLTRRASASESIWDNQKQMDFIKHTPARPKFSLLISDEQVPTPPTVISSGQDSIEAKNFRTAAIDLNRQMAVKSPVKTLEAFDLKDATSKVRDAINPFSSFPKKLVSIVQFPGGISLADPEKMLPAMAYPDIPDPMYKNLTDISSELLLPNLKLVPPNTISLLETNPPFIESYLVGLNHEMGRELLWREYPTDQRGSYFRQFWDVNGIVKPSSDKSPEVLAEENKDIKPIDTWKRKSNLGSHDNRNPGSNSIISNTWNAIVNTVSGEQPKKLVLIIRSDLLKRYPNTIIFAQKAIDGKDSSGQGPVIRTEFLEDTFDKEIKFPLFKAEILPDIKFYGFDLTIDQARGTEETLGDNLGWFFVIQEIPGEPRFGMDISFSQSGAVATWNDLAWDLFPSDMQFITRRLAPCTENGFECPDGNWGTNSANMTRILFQKPSMVAVHASEMLDKLD
jgi:hypothetical protein